MSNEDFKTEQEAFWAGSFGTEYIKRNQSDALVASNLSFFSKALSATSGIKSTLEFGANVGMNLQALKLLNRSWDLHAIEINRDAAAELRNVISSENVYNTTILDFDPSKLWDLVFIKGVLIHIHPEELPQVYDKLVAASSCYVLVGEYYNPTPVSVSYRGHEDRLFKRDFAGEIMDRHPYMKLLDYGFVYHRDSNHPQDDLTWFLLEKG